MWARAPHNPFDAIAPFFAHHPKLAPGTPLHSLLASSKHDNSPSALFSRLFDLQFQRRAFSALPDVAALRDVCAWILDYMDRKQAVADNAHALHTRKLAREERHTPLYSHEEPIANPQAFAWGLFKSGAPQRELGLVYTDQAQQPAAAPALPSPPHSDVSNNSTDATPTLLPQAWEPVPPAPTDMAEHSWGTAGIPASSSSMSLATTAAPSDGAGSSLDNMSGEPEEQPPTHCFNVDDPVMPSGSQLSVNVPDGYYMHAYNAGVTAAHAFLEPEPASEPQTDNVVKVLRTEWEQVQRALDLAGVLVACKLM